MNTNKYDSDIWLIRGAPGVGKSAVGRRLKKKIRSSVVIEVDVLRSMRSNINWTDEISHRIGLQQAAGLAKSFTKIGLKPVIIIDTLLGENLGFLAGLLTICPAVITLVAEEETLLRRARGRTSGYENERVIREMNIWFRSNQNANCYTIDTTKLSADEVTNQILEFGYRDSWNQSAQRNNEDRDKDETERISPMIYCKPDGRLYLIRHSDTDKTFPSPANVLPGPPLSRSGIEKAERLRAFFKGMNIARLVCSPFDRAFQTASIIGCSAFIPVESDAWSEVAPSEPFSDVRKRVREWLQGNLPVRGETVLVVGHGATLNAAIELFAAKEFKEAKRDRYGNIVNKAGIWLLEWLNGKISYTGPVEP